MSSAAVFKLIANDGKADRMIMATALLRQRILDIYNARKHAGKSDITPTLVDLERTHILYVNAHFKPFAAIGYEYTKIRPQSGSAQLGGGVTFSIPQYGDFFYDIVVRTTIEPAYADRYDITPTTYPYYDLNGVPLTANGQAGAVTGIQNFVRYCEYPGYRLFNKVSFEVNGNPLDQYDTDTIVMLDKFTKPVNKASGSDKLVGQQVPLTGYTDVVQSAVVDYDVSSSTASAYNTPSGIGRWDKDQSSQQVALYGLNNGATQNTQWPSVVLYNTGTSSAATPFPQPVPLGSNPAKSYVKGFSTTVNSGGASTTSPIYLDQDTTPATYQYDFTQQQMQIVNGYQVPKPIQPTLELWNKLRFWFNDDVRLAIPSVSIPFGQRFINIDLCSATDLVFEYPSVYVPNVPSVLNPAVTNVGPPAFQTTGGTGNPAGSNWIPWYQTGGLGAFDIKDMEMYINNIFVNPEIHDIYIKRIGFSLIRVYRKQSSSQNQDVNEVLLSNLKWPIEYMLVGFRPKFNTMKPTNTSGSAGTSIANLLATAPYGNWEMWHDWHRMTRQLPSYTTPDSGYVQINNGGGTASALTGYGWSLQQTLQGGKVKYWTPVPTVDRLGLVSHGIAIYDNLRDVFFNQYVPYNYGGWNLNTPEDPGAFLVNMALYPRSYQPSGHINISRARETYLRYESSYISSATPCMMIVIAIAINFLLITDGSAILRYST